MLFQHPTLRERCLDVTLTRRLVFIFLFSALSTQFCTQNIMQWLLMWRSMGWGVLLGTFDVKGTNCAWILASSVLRIFSFSYGTSPSHVTLLRITSILYLEFRGYRNQPMNVFRHRLTGFCILNTFFNKLYITSDFSQQCIFPRLIIMILFLFFNVI